MISNICRRFLIENHHKFVRYKQKPDHWSQLRKKNKATDKALAHFDEFYPTIFGINRWEDIRKGLLGKQKYVAVINNYSDNDEVMAKLELTGALNIRTLCNLEKERLLEELKSKHRAKLMREIRRLDRILEEKVAKDDEEDLKKTPKLSLQESLDNAEIDYQRLIDGNTEILNEFVPVSRIKGKEDYIPESEHFRFVDDSKKFDVKIEREYDWNFPEHLNVYCYEEENYSDFAPAKLGSTGVLGYYLMDGASILPVLALGIRPGDKFLDMCAAPGGKSLLVIQTLYPKLVVCNDISMGRTNRIYNVCRQFLYDLDERWLDAGRLQITTRDARHIKDEQYDRILVDVPCTTDRHSVVENDNNIFKPGRIKERLKLPELQVQLLVNALKLVKKGGTVVYSTCSLSPIQNDGVVHMALKQLWEETNIKVVIKDLSFPILQTRNVFKFANMKIMRYGQLVVPEITQNFGPMYFCKLQRIQ